MVNYQNGKIYKIICNKTGLCYIGSTTKDYLSKRLAEHRNNFNLWKNRNKKYYTTSFKILENDDYEIILIENYPCNNRDELNARERYWIENTECVNLQIPYHNEEEKKLHKLQSQRKYREKNQLKTKNYYEKNKDRLNQQKKEYNEKNKDKIKEKNGKIVDCECGFSFTFRNKSRHLKTIRHQKYITSFKVLENETK